MNRQNQKKILMVVIGLLILSAILFYYHKIKIPRVAMAVETSLREELDVDSMPKESVWVVTKPGGISKYTEITNELMSEYVTLTEMPTQYIVEGTIGEIESIEGMITKFDLSYGQQLLLDQFLTNEDWYGDEERLKEFAVTSLVANEVKAGNIVDVLVHYGDGDYDVVVSKIKVRKIIEHLSKEDDQDQDEGENHTIILSVNERQYRDLTLARELGDLETRLYLDLEQLQSEVTFNYTKALERQSLSILNQKGSQAIKDGAKDQIFYERNRN